MNVNLRLDRSTKIDTENRGFCTCRRILGFSPDGLRTVLGCCGVSAVLTHHALADRGAHDNASLPQMMPMYHFPVKVTIESVMRLLKSAYHRIVMMVSSKCISSDRISRHRRDSQTMHLHGALRPFEHISHIFAVCVLTHLYSNFSRSE